MEDFDHFILKGETEQGYTEFYCTPVNTELYLHHPKWRDVDHIFIRINEKERRLGAFVWRHVLGEEVFEEHAHNMTDSFNWDIYYRVNPTDNDLEQFEKDFIQIPSELPEDFR
jgi:hypothetical protein